MLRYVDVMEVFREVPDEVTLAVNVSGCPVRCPGCHSPWLWEDRGLELSEDALLGIVRRHPGVTCVAIMGGDADPGAVASLLAAVKREFGPGMRTCWYSGREAAEALRHVSPQAMDYVKVGPYVEERGPLDDPRTNQRMYRVVGGEGPDGAVAPRYVDITPAFWKGKV